MPPRKGSNSETSPRRRPATTPEAREQQMIALADSLAERQLREGTASAQVITHYLKLASSREQLEQEKLRKENQLREAQIKQIAAAADNEKLYKKALAAMRGYQGSESFDDDES